MTAMHQPSVCNSFFSQPPQLRLLSVENCGVGDRGLEVLRGLTALQSLDIRWEGVVAV